MMIERIRYIDALIAADLPRDQFTIVNSAWLALMGIRDNGDLDIVITSALVLQVITSNLIGAMLPLIVAKFKLDPATVASPALTTLVDISGLLLFFSLAKMILQV